MSGKEENNPSRVQVSDLARFPEENPFPVLRVAADGTIVYSNTSGMVLVEEWGSNVGKKVPANWQAIITEALERNRNHAEEIQCGETLFLVVIAPIPESGYVNLYGRDVTKQKQQEDALRESEQRIRRKMETILSPVGDIGKLELEDIIDVPAVQKLMEVFYELTHIPMSIIDMNGKVLVGVGWQEICTKFHRVNPQARTFCLESDLKLSADAEEGKFKLYKCKNNLWDAATPIIIGGKKMGNLFTGQFFFDDEIPDYELFRKQAHQYGFDESEYMAALKKMPRLNRQAIDRGMEFLYNFAQMFSQLSYGNIKLTRLIEEQKKAQQAIQENEQRLQLAAEAANFGTYDVDLINGTVYWSPKFRKIVGLAPDTATPRAGHIPDFLHPDDIERIKQMRQMSHDPAGNGEIEYEYRIIRPDGQIRWVWLQGQVMFDTIDGKKRAVRSAGVLLDITERKQAEEALAQIREDLERAQNVGNIGSWRMDVRKNKLTWSDENHRMFGIPKGTPMTYETFLSTVHPDDREYVDTQWQAGLRGEKYDIEHRIIVDGKTKWVREKAYLEFDENGGLIGGFGITQDITRRRRMQEKLRVAYDEMEERIKQRTMELADTVNTLEAEVRQRIAAENAVSAERRHFQDVLDSLPAYVILLSKEYRIQFANRFFEQHFGTPDPDKSCYEFLYGLDKPCDYCVVPELLKTGRVQEWEWSAPDEQDYFVRDFLFTDTDGNTLVMEMGIDITDRKQAQERIRLTNILLESFTKKNSRKEYLDTVTKVLCDWTKCECIGIRLLDAEGKIPYESWIGFSEEFLAVENDLSLHDDTCLCIRAITQTTHASDIPLVTGHSSFHSPDTQDFIKSLSGKEKDAYRGHCIRHGFASLAVIPIRYRGSIIGVFHLADKAKNKIPSASVEFLENMAMLVGEAIHRFNVEESLKVSRTRLLEAQRIARIGNWEWDFQTGRIFWSDEIYRIFGVMPDEFEPNNEVFRNFVHPADRKIVNEAEMLAKEAGSHAIDYRIIKSDGTERIIHEIAEVIYDKEKNPVKMAGTLHDITELKQAEQAVLEQQQTLRAMAAELQLAEERQRRQIAEDLHDSIGPILSFSTRELRSLKTNVSPEVAATLKEVTGKLDVAIQQARTLSFDLSPSLLYDLGLEVAIEDLADRFTAERNIECRFQTSSVPKLLSEDIKIILYRSVRELLINAAKHAEPSKVDVSISRDDSYICIRVEDDGMGFDPKILSEEAEKKGFGLFSIRERLTHIGGDLKIESFPGKGTIMILTAPLKPGKGEPNK